MGIVYSSSHVKATRKPHLCAYCNNEIAAGGPALYEHGVFDGRPFSRHCCPDCEPFIADFWDYSDGEAYDLPVDFWEWVRECRVPHPSLTVEVECPRCGTVRVMEREWSGDGWANCPECDELLEAPC